MAGPRIEYRALGTLAELREAVEVILEVWGDLERRQIVNVGWLRALALAGDPVLGAFDRDGGGRLCGVSVGFVGPVPELHLHSHITGVLDAYQHAGVGYGLKLAQRDWCLANGIELVTWTFDPMIARNAYFNLHKLGGVATRFLPDFYGPMDDGVNRGEATDRLEVQWRIASDRVDRALRGEGVIDELPAGARTVPVPVDHVALRREDPAAARTWRATAGEQLAAALAAGLVAVDFTPETGYVLARAS